MAATMEDTLVEAEKANNASSIDPLLKIIRASDAEVGGDPVKLKERAIYAVAKVYASLGRAKELADLVKEIRPFFNSVSKAKTAKIVRNLLDRVSEIPDTLALQVEVAEEAVEWAVQSKRMFLRQRVEAKLAELWMQTKEYTKALQLVGKLSKELKKLDEKMLLLEVQLVECQVYHALRNIAKAKAALTAARTNANAIYCPPMLQATIDLQAGVIQAEETDYKTAYSYFYEAFESFSTLEDPKATRALKYMMLCKIMLSKPQDVSAIMSNKLALQYTGGKNRDIDAMQAIASAGTERSLGQFQEAQQKYATELMDDPVTKMHLAKLYESILEDNLCRLIEPFSRVEISHIAGLIKLPPTQVEHTLSRMIIDKKFDGILDQGAGIVIVYEDAPTDKTYPTALEVISNMSNVVTALNTKRQSLLSNAPVATEEENDKSKEKEKGEGKEGKDKDAKSKSGVDKK